MSTSTKTFYPLCNMQFGNTQMRRMPEGWQCLKNGDDTNPDRWCDVEDIFGPMGGDDTTAFFDELWQEKKLAEQSRRKACKNCMHWVLEPESEHQHHCDFINTIDGERVAKTTGCEIFATAHDDSGLIVNMRTAPDYSCNHFFEWPF